MKSISNEPSLAAAAAASGGSAQRRDETSGEPGSRSFKTKSSRTVSPAVSAKIAAKRSRNAVLASLTDVAPTNGVAERGGVRPRTRRYGPIRPIHGGGFV